MKNLVIIGGIGNGTVIASTVEDINDLKKEWRIIGFLNDFEIEPINGYPVLGKIEKQVAHQLIADQDAYFLYTLISTKLNHKFIPKLTDLEIPIERFATLIHPSAVVSRFAEIGHGVCIQPLVSVGPNVKIGNHIQIYAQCLVGHNAILDDYSYVANNSCIGAHVHLKKGAYLGTNCSLLENVTIGEWALVGIGTVVLRDVPDYTKVVGNPARVIGKVE